MGWQELVVQYQYKKFGEFVLHLVNNFPEATLAVGFDGAVDTLSMDYDFVADWIDEINPLGAEKIFWAEKTTSVMDVFTNLANEKLSNNVGDSNFEAVDAMVRIAVFNFSVAASRNHGSKAFIHQSVGMNFFKRFKDAFA